MKQTVMEPRHALDKIVCSWIQKFENIHPFTDATHHYDEETGDEFITVFDSRTDSCLTVWITPSWYGNDVLNLARDIISSKIKR